MSHIINSKQCLYNAKKWVKIQTFSIITVKSRTEGTTRRIETLNPKHGLSFQQWYLVQSSVTRTKYPTIQREDFMAHNFCPGWAGNKADREWQKHDGRKVPGSRKKREKEEARAHFSPSHASGPLPSRSRSSRHTLLSTSMDECTAERVAPQSKHVRDIWGTSET